MVDRLISHKMNDLIKQKLREISSTFKVKILDIEMDRYYRDYIHMLFKLAPNKAVAGEIVKEGF